MLILVRDIGLNGCRCATLWHNLNLTFDLAVVALLPCFNSHSLGIFLLSQRYIDCCS